MDKFDKAILEILQQDASLSVGEVAERVALSKTACWRRIQKLEQDGVIRGRVALLSQEQVNLPLTAYIAVRTNKHNEKWSEQFRKVVNNLPQVLEVYRTSGDLDYLIKAVITDMAGYDQLYKALIKADLYDVSASFVMETMKHTTELPLDYM
ncbi:Lrp/AsnC family transcriptional regulator [Endozoicomonas sp. SM1973]|uniref:Lrp/AsnC family transcriptional regulator n=1 Tax=Spartinivicinus marinus TaxID=2994442 RepID=A0A853IEZ3_9GAMM|nr:Lrp/AsnC family transcriptional regulator [Spartinivicinus marinus]MCX4028387.1 Lrp/AsnC family transcriptional regulator [Spartinivicinus marinus]NYZ68614.1 Lrp/AsnC family transcriptional regulator [Spartinivicinus marinus]